jgi:hypothetical protein
MHKLCCLLLAGAHLEERQLLTASATLSFYWNLRIYLVPPNTLPHIQIQCCLGAKYKHWTRLLTHHSNNDKNSSVHLVE